MTTNQIEIPEGKFKCPICNTIQTKKNKSRHMKSHEFFCEICNRTIENEIKEVHIENHRINPPVIEEILPEDIKKLESGKYHCATCNKDFRNWQRHINTFVHQNDGKRIKRKKFKTIINSVEFPHDSNEINEIFDVYKNDIIEMLSEENCKVMFTLGIEIEKQNTDETANYGLNTKQTIILMGDNLEDKFEELRRYIIGKPIKHLIVKYEY